MTSKIKQLTIASVDRACGGLTRPLKQLAAVLICFGQRYISPSSTVLLDRPFDCLPPPPPPPPPPPQPVIPFLLPGGRNQPSMF